MSSLTVESISSERTIVSVSMVKNECDIVESFVRHHCKFVDRMIILDNGSTDATSKILNFLKAELPIDVLYDPTPSYSQDAIMTNLTNRAFDLYKADLVLPLDCDEFIYAIDGQQRLHLEAMTSTQSEVFYLPWVTYIPSEEDDPTERNPTIRIGHRRLHEGAFVHKVAIPRDSFSGNDSLTQGSHALVGESNARCSNVVSETLSIAHYPIRSSEQAISKYVIGWLANLARNNGVLFDWLPYYKLSKKRLYTGLDPATLRKMAMEYANTPCSNNDIVFDPLSDHSGYNSNLKYGDLGVIDPIKNLVDYSEMLAKSHGNLFVGKGDLNEANTKTLSKIISYQEIEGWLSPLEAINIYKAIANHPSNRITIVEIGSWLGKSSYVIAKAVQDSGKSGMVYCIDPFNADGDSFSKAIYQSSRFSQSLYEQFTKNMHDHGVLDFIKPIRKYSSDALSDVPEDIDILFIDGNHEFESVRDDFQHWAPRLKESGVILVHDVGSESQPGPRRMVTEYIIGKDGWGKYELYDELFVCRKASVD